MPFAALNVIQSVVSSWPE